MFKSKQTVKSTTSLAAMSTWRSGILQSSVHRSTKKITDDFLTKYDLSTMQWLIIGAIFEAGDAGVRLTELATIVGTTSGYLTNAINMLEAKGIIVRTGRSDDSRMKMLTIAPHYRQTCAKIEHELRELLRMKIYKNINRDELETYITVLQKLSRVD